MVQLPPGAMDPEQVLVCEKALPDPLANVIPEMFQIQVTRVGESLVVSDELRVVNPGAPLLTK